MLLGGVLEVVNFFLVAIPTNLCHLGSLIVQHCQLLDRLFLFVYVNLKIFNPFIGFF